MLAPQVTQTTYTTTTTINNGAKYKFKVQARTQMGYSSDSQEIEVMAAVAPDAPINLAIDDNSSSETQITLTWQDGVNSGGSPVIDYSVFYDQGQGGAMI